MKGINVGNR